MYATKRGFTLIEILVVLAIVGILVAVAYPQYRTYVVDANRGEARSNLLRMVDAQERFYIENNRYADTAELAFISRPTKGDVDLYVYAVEASDNSTFTLSAVPVGDQKQARDATCNPITLNSAGVKNPVACW